MVVPTHDRAHLVVQTLRSILSQRDVDLEVVVVDDGSSDGTADIIRSLGEPRLRVVRNQVARRLVAARNRGLSEARGQWVAFCDDDDLWAPGKLAAQLGALKAEPAARWAIVGEVAFTLSDRAVRLTHVKDPPHAEEVPGALAVANPVPGGGSGTVVETALVRDLGGFRPLPAAEDWDLWVRVSTLAPVVSVPEPLVGYRLHLGSHSHDDGRMRDGQRAVLDATAGTRSMHGLEVSWDEMLRHRARQAARSGDRSTALHAHLARWSAGPANLAALVEAGFVAVAPRWWESARDVRTGGRITRQTAMEIAQWLGPLVDRRRVVAGLRSFEVDPARSE